MTKGRGAWAQAGRHAGVDQVLGRGRGTGLQHLCRLFPPGAGPGPGTGLQARHLRQEVRNAWHGGGTLSRRRGLGPPARPPAPFRDHTPKPFGVTEAMGVSAVAASVDCNAQLVIVFTSVGYATRYVSKYRPAVPQVGAGPWENQSRSGRCGVELLCRGPCVATCCTRLVRALCARADRRQGAGGCSFGMDDGEGGSSCDGK